MKPEVKKTEVRDLFDWKVWIDSDCCVPHFQPVDCDTARCNKQCHANNYENTYFLAFFHFESTGRLLFILLFYVVVLSTARNYLDIKVVA